MEAFFLGLSTGWYCLLSCGLYLLPFLVAENTGGRKNAGYVVLFLAGRLFSYALVGMVAGFAGALLAADQASLFQHLTAISSWLIGALLLVGGLFGAFPTLKPCRLIGRVYKPGLGALAFGVLTGLAICPPFVAAIIAVLAKASAWSGVKYFLWFYLGTSIYFLPLFGVSIKLFRNPAIKNVARLVMIMMAGYFLLKAITATL